jgi:ribose 5-phosphate isomerase
LSLADKPVSFECRIELVDPTGDLLEQVTNTFQLQKNSRRTRQRIRVDGFVVTDSGDYVYRVKTKEDDDDDFQTVNEIPFAVRGQT